MMSVNRKYGAPVSPRNRYLSFSPFEMTAIRRDHVTCYIDEFQALPEFWRRTGAWRSQEMAPGKNLHFGGSKFGGWVYHNWKLGAKMEIPDKNLLLQRGSHIPKS